MLSVYDMLKLDEGLRYKVYTDTVGKATVGIGFNMDSSSAKGLWLRANIGESFSAVYSGQSSLSTNSIVSLFNTCIDGCRVDLESIFNDFETYPEHAQLALINLMFNMGKSVFTGFHTTINLLKAKDFNGASDHLAGTGWASQLPVRSARVRKLLKGDYSGYTV